MTRRAACSPRACGGCCVTGWGHEAVAVLDGGLDAWKKEGHALTAELPAVTPAAYTLKTPRNVVDTAFVLAHLEQPAMTLVDARAADRFRGENETMDPVGGHIPGARNRFFKDNLDASGKLIAWDNRSCSGSVSHQFFKRTLGLPAIGPDKAAAEGEYDMQYEIIHQRIRHAIVDCAVPLGNWRSVGHSHNAFFKESFIDELAHASGQGSVQFRRALLAQHPRHGRHHQPV